MYIFYITIYLFSYDSKQANKIFQLHCGCTLAKKHVLKYVHMYSSSRMRVRVACTLNREKARNYNENNSSNNNNYSNTTELKDVRTGIKQLCKQVLLPTVAALS